MVISFCDGKVMVYNLIWFRMSGWWFQTMFICPFHIWDNPNPLPLCKAGQDIVRGIFDHSGSVSEYKADDPKSAIEAHLRALAHPAYNTKCRREQAIGTHEPLTVQEHILLATGCRDNDKAGLWANGMVVHTASGQAVFSNRDMCMGNESDGWLPSTRRGPCDVLTTRYGPSLLMLQDAFKLGFVGKETTSEDHIIVPTLPVSILMNTEVGDSEMNAVLAITAVNKRAASFDGEWLTIPVAHATAPGTNSIVWPVATTIFPAAPFSKWCAAKAAQLPPWLHYPGARAEKWISGEAWTSKSISNGSLTFNRGWCHCPILGTLDITKNSSHLVEH